MSEVNYRNATFSDLESIVNIYNSTIPSRMVTADTEPVSVESKIQWFETHTPEKHPLWVIEDEKNQITGWISFRAFYGRPAYSETAEISIYLDENQRGKGMGKKTLAYSLSQCPGLGIKTILGFIFAHNEPSLKLFRHFGFEDWGTLPEVAVLDGEEKSLKILGIKI
ncbi:phosphinothricin acetyltransferase [Pedobacter lusitanus]|uniref:Phosphinothricin acetyltransferase n=1 Tax=Pedobacter lusitanus TaxID=1503925 RepID=A0A0D0GNN1_9SPHI|nr:GNAT family N-acetyltransferase [Pedobacter lusitanus]KIO78812.1 phosphinothricin acetyltransferase [Pedobacter lusitanus]